MKHESKTSNDREDHLRELETLRKRVASLEKAEREHARAEKALHESEERYRSLTENVNVGVYRNTIGPEGKFIEANPAIVRMFGYAAREEFLSMNVANLYQNPDDRKKFNEKMLKEGFVRNEELQLKRKDGSWFVGSISAVSIRDKEGNVKFYDGIIEDITERKRMDEALRESRQRFKEMMDNSPSVIYMKDIDGRFLFVNRRFEELFHVSNEEAVGKTDYDVFPKEMSDVFRANDLEVMESGTLWMADEQAPHDDGIHTYLSIKFPIRDADGTVTGISGISTDITERKLTEEALRESEERYRDLFENANDLIQMVAPDGKILYVNRAWRETLGYEEHEIDGITIFDVLCPGEREHCMEMFRKVMCGEKVSRVETTFAAKDGREIPVEGSASCRFVDGEPVSTRGIFRDITDRKKTEESLERANRNLSEANKRLIEADEIKNEFVSILAHDLGTPIAIMKGNLQMLKMGRFGELNEEQSQKLDTVLRSAIRLDKLRMDTLELSRMDLGTMTLVEQPVMLTNIITEAVEDIKDLAAEKKQHISVKLPEFEIVNCDPGKIRQVLDNYLSNALRYTQEGGRIHVGGKIEPGKMESGRTEPGKTGSDERGGRGQETVTVWVKDNGRGIPREKLEKVFERFYRTGKRVPGSTGLGLAIVKGVVEAHGGRAWCESEGEGKGSTFFFTLPRNRE